MDTTVTIDKSYFETLLRRAECHLSGQDFVASLDLPTVNIPKVDHENLLRMAHEYMRLKEALYQGGVDASTLEILIRGDPAANLTATDATDFIGRGSRAPPGDRSWISLRKDASSPKVLGDAFGSSYATHTAANKLYLGQGSHLYSPRSASNEDVYCSNGVVKDDNVSSCDPRSGRPSYPKMERDDQRSIVLKNLSDRATHQDVVNVIRGGPLLDVYLRSQDKSAIVSFVHGNAAQEFFAHVRRNDVYIHGRRIKIGATRNLVIHGVHPSMTEQSLRDDLDHIHNLIIISISFTGNDAYLSLNSVRNSLFARTCMMSRAKYKTMKIEWYPDECGSSLPKVQNSHKKGIAPPPAAKETPVMNRFQMLSMEDDDDATEAGSSFGEDDEPTMTSGFSSLQTSRRTPWDLARATA